ncbi:methyltransferase family protein [Haloactinospora alba]|uniref:Methyltransferase family protein n=1 Tax=Haloactinospora alba TaxID=405555 RepID=A0A543NMD1_9ACTN|nr:class I SAM-dependent methyltransferase [Haloactinospora alba]TQN32992.1 methyltransferase family protein [Haloactinospora alba]
MTSDPSAALQALRTPDGQRLLGAVSAADAAADPLAAATRLRRDPHARAAAGDDGADDVAAAALTQIRLRDRARAKFGDEAEAMYFTTDGLEQATRLTVARHRAGRFASALAPGSLVADVCCGIGADTLSMARAGLAVEGVDSDPHTVAVANANIDAWGVGQRATARVADAEALDAGAYDAVFCDPARRGQRGRVFDPDAYSPPWSTVLGLARGARAACVKAAPGIPHERVPEGAHAEWVSVNGEVKEAALWFGALGGSGRRATLLREGSAEPATLTSAAEEDSAPVAAPGRYLYEPDGAVVRAHLVAAAAREVDGALLDPHIAYITADRLVATPFCRAYEVTDVLPFSAKRLRAVLRERRVGTVTIKKRGSAVDVDKLRRDLKPSGPNSAVVVLTRIDDRPVCLLCKDAASAR